MVAFERAVTLMVVLALPPEVSETLVGFVVAVTGTGDPLQPWLTHMLIETEPE